MAAAWHSYCSHRLAIHPYILPTSLTSPPFTPSIHRHRLTFFLHRFLNFAFVAPSQYPYPTMKSQVLTCIYATPPAHVECVIVCIYPQFYFYALLISPCDFYFVVMKPSLTNDFLYFSLCHSHPSWPLVADGNCRLHACTQPHGTVVRVHPRLSTLLLLSYSPSHPPLHSYCSFPNYIVAMPRLVFPALR